MSALTFYSSTATYTDAVSHNTHHTQAGVVLARSAPIIPVTPTVTVSSRTLAAAAGIQSVLQTLLSSVLCMPAAYTYINTVPHIQLPGNTINMHTCTSHAPRNFAFFAVKCASCILVFITDAAFGLAPRLVTLVPCSVLRTVRFSSYRSAQLRHQWTTNMEQSASRS